LEENNVLGTPAVNMCGFVWKIHMFLQLWWIVLFGSKWTYFHSEYCDLQDVFLKKETHCSHVNNEQDALLLQQRVFFWQIHMFLQLRWIGLLTTKWAIIYIEKYD
jgi:hypothetical protein